MLTSPRWVAATLSALVLILTGATITPYHRNQRAFYVDPKLAAFVRPGLLIKINSAQVARNHQYRLYSHRPTGTAVRSDRSRDTRSDFS
jgi:hypothetical protein